jgi:hypothetical protein
VDQPRPLDYREALDLLDSWTGKNVLALSHSQVPGKTMSHTQLAVEGELGPLQMVDNQIDSNADSVAAYSLGDGNTAVYLSSGDFERAILLSERHVNIAFRDNFHIELQLT